MQKNKALFLDRDGVVCAELGRYRLAGDGFELLPGIKEVVSFAKKNGYKVVVVTNQPQVSKGMLSEEELSALHSRMKQLMDGMLDAVYYCPHSDEDNCDCRKPKPGMLRRAIEDLDIDAKQSILIGDGCKDILAGQAMGCRTVFIKNDFKAHSLANCAPDYTIEALAELIPLLK